MNTTTPKTVDAYIAGFPDEAQVRLQEVRRTIQQAAPKATEKISYAMPTFVLEGNLVHFAAFKNHIGFYPVPTGIEAFQDELAGYKQGKGSVQFPLDQPLPLALIGRITQFRVNENKQKAADFVRKKGDQCNDRQYKTTRACILLPID